MSQNQNQYYPPPPGPPPSYGSHAYGPPSGPPPEHHDDAPPLDPPPPHSDYAPPPGPPPPPQAPIHDWQHAVPDTSLLPPPPSVGNERSSTNNATAEEAARGESWCQQNPLRGPIHFSHDALIVMARGDVGLVKPRTYQGDLIRLRQGVWAGKTRPSYGDSCITSGIPLYSVYAHSPLHTGKSKTIYYEVKISRGNRREVDLALGFAAPPYPTFRLPGWHRGCLAVHGDDGSKFINDIDGGRNFTTAFQPGQTVGIGMTFTARNLDLPPAYNDGPAQTTVTKPINVDVFFTKDGRKDGSWNLHEERDEIDLPVTGLEGMHDLHAAIGTFENVEFEIVFNPAEWMYHP